MKTLSELKAMLKLTEVPGPDQDGDTQDYIYQCVEFVSDLIDSGFGDPVPAKLDLLQAPFKYDGHSYIWDADNQVVSDDSIETDGQVQRIRGWGRLGSMPNGAKLQDDLAHAFAQALNLYWIIHGQVPNPNPASL